MAVVDVIVWILVGAFVFGPLSFGLYLVFASSDQLEVNYENYMLRKTALPLKGEDFRDLPRVVLSLRVLGVSLILFALMLAMWVIYATIRTSTVLQ